MTDTFIHVFRFYFGFIGFLVLVLLGWLSFVLISQGVLTEFLAGIVIILLICYAMGTAIEKYVL